MLGRIIPLTEQIVKLLHLALPNLMNFFTTPAYKQAAIGRNTLPSTAIAGQSFPTIQISVFLDPQSAHLEFGTAEDGPGRWSIVW